MPAPFNLRPKLKGPPLLVEGPGELNIEARRFLARPTITATPVAADEVSVAAWRNASAVFFTAWGAEVWLGSGRNKAMPMRPQTYLLDAEESDASIDLNALSARAVSVDKHGEWLVQMVNVESQRVPVVFIAGSTPGARSGDVAVGMISAAHRHGVPGVLLQCRDGAHEMKGAIDAAIENSALVIVSTSAPTTEGALTAIGRADRVFVVAEDAPVTLAPVAETVMELRYGALEDPQLIVATQPPGDELAEMLANRFKLRLAGTFVVDAPLQNMDSGPFAVGENLFRNFGLHSPSTEIGFGR